MSSATERLKKRYVAFTFCRDYGINEEYRRRFQDLIGPIELEIIGTQSAHLGVFQDDLRVASRHPDLKKAHHRFDENPIRDFVPLLVERRAHEKLGDVPKATRNRSRTSASEPQSPPDHSAYHLGITWGEVIEGPMPVREASISVKNVRLVMPN
ncbi:three-helix bundle dimerization domain-containing protein [Nocardia sp. 348MFTsu5.1]|uniref:three-helix bundle dimerization domain-containing protein n=1 Tax=Nocardia sp. 348MFTsu5.1 TaxID=1172185 RepID=UPI000378A244|nr:hypothetical protein [Nocardia sp. 348MFTsu5.1]